MRAVWFERQGPASEVLRIGERPTPRAAAGEVRVRLHASGVNPADTNRRAGRGYVMEGPAVIPDSDGAGIVDEVGAGVDPAWLGKRVWLYNGQRGGRVDGTAAEWIALDAGLVAPLADGTSFAEGACLGIPCMTAHRCVHLRADLAGAAVLVTGGAGAVGHYAVQWAKRAGARVATTVSSPDKAAHAATASPDLVIDYRREDVAGRLRDFAGPGGVDHVVDVDFGGNLATSLAAIAVNGSIAYYATKGAPTPALPAADLMRRNVSIHAVLLNNAPLAARRRAQADIAAALADRGLRHAVSAVFPLARTADAHDAVEACTKRGTVVVDCRA
ncbi:MAG: NADPH:quinone reductase [Rhodospirillales bacterium]|nr:MAG: NADPH:quinone reductase [Rhodospirillales bacterium]